MLCATGAVGNHVVCQCQQLTSRLIATLTAAVGQVALHTSGLREWLLGELARSPPDIGAGLEPRGSTFAIL